MSIFTRHGRALLLSAAAVCLSAAVFSASAEEGGGSKSKDLNPGPLGLHKNAIGLRFGGGSMFGAELNYQLAMGEANRLEAGLRWDSYSTYYYFYRRTYTYIGAAGFYEWFWNIGGASTLNGALNWYAGPGATVGIWNVGPVTTILGTKIYDGKTGVYLNIGGTVGLEYDFNVNKVPLLMTLDARPLIGLLGRDDGVNFFVDVAWSLRYTF